MFNPWSSETEQSSVVLLLAGPLSTAHVSRTFRTTQQDTIGCASSPSTVTEVEEEHAELSVAEVCDAEAAGGVGEAAAGAGEVATLFIAFTTAVACETTFDVLLLLMPVLLRLLMKRYASPSSC